MNDKLVKINEKILSKINAYSMTKANMPVRAELADIHSMIKEAIISHNNGWISIKDELPDDKAEVLAYRNSPVCGDLIYHCIFKDSKFLEKTSFLLAGKGGITHWQPLPKLPKE